MSDREGSARNVYVGGNYCVRKSHEGAIKVHARERLESQGL